MPSPRLAPRSPLDDATLPSDENFSVVDAPPCIRLAFRGGEEARARCSTAFGVDLATKLGSAAENGDRAALWLGPDEWLLIAEGDSAETPAAAIERSLSTIPHSLVDISHRLVSLTASGAQAARVLNAGCPLDLRLKAFPVGMATRTLFEKAEIVLWRLQERQFRIEVGRSFAPYLAAALAEAARGAPIEPVRQPNQPS